MDALLKNNTGISGFTVTELQKQVETLQQKLSFRDQEVRPYLLQNNERICTADKMTVVNSLSRLASGVLRFTDLCSGLYLMTASGAVSLLVAKHTKHSHYCDRDIRSHSIIEFNSIQLSGMFLT